MLGPWVPLLQWVVLGSVRPPAAAGSPHTWGVGGAPEESPDAAHSPHRLRSTAFSAAKYLNFEGQMLASAETTQPHPLVENSPKVIHK